MPSVKVLTLSAAPETHGAVAEILRKTWPGYYGPYGPGDAAADVAARSSGADLPVGFVAMGHAPIGTVTVNTASFGVSDAGEGPWLMGLAVVPEARNAGVGSALVAAAEDHARKTGASCIYSTTRSAAGLLQQRGWVVQRDVTERDGVVWQVYRKAL